MLIVYKVRVKDGKVAEFQKLANETLVPEAYKLPGCRLFSLYQNTANEHEFIFHELWDGENDVHEYKLNLIAALGEPHPSEQFPAFMNDMIEADEDLA